MSAYAVSTDDNKKTTLMQTADGQFTLTHPHFALIQQAKQQEVQYFDACGATLGNSVEENISRILYF